VWGIRTEFFSLGLEVARGGSIGADVANPVVGWTDLKYFCPHISKNWKD
jgi:hypothetical protein